MARQVLPWVGAAVGMMAGGNWQLGFAIGSIIGNAVDPQVIRGPQLGEGTNNTASEGGYRPIVLGKGAVGACMIHEGPIIKRTIRTRQSKGGGPVTTEQRAYRTMAFGLGESADPAQGVTLLRLWVDNKLRYDVTPTSPIVEESAEFAGEFTFYPGNETQEPDPDLEALPVEWGGGAGNVPAYRGGAPYIVLPEWDVTDSGGRAPMIKAELAGVIINASATTVASGNGTGGPGDDFTSVSATGASFGEPEGVGSALHMVALAYPRIYGWNNVMDGWITDDFGETKTNVGPVDGWGGPHVPDYHDGVLLIPGSLDGIFRSTNEGASISLVPDSPRSTCIGIIEGLAVSVYDPTEADYSISSGASWAKGGDTGLYEGYTVSARTKTNDSIIFGSGVIDPEAKPAVSVTRNGTVFVPHVLNDSEGTMVTAMCAAQIGGNWRIVLTTDVGEIYRTDDEFETVELSDDTFAARDITYNGTNFVMIAADVGGPRIVYSPDGLSISPSVSDYDGSMWSIASTGYSLIESGKIPLSYIVAWIHERVDAERYDVSELTDMVEGVVFADGYTGASAIQAFMPLYHFDAGEYDAGTGYRVNYVKRGAPAVMTLTDQNIVEGPEDWEREDSYERPKVLHVAYQNPIADYGAPNIVIKRTSPDVLVVGERSASVPVVFSDVDEITRRADIMMTVIYTEIAGTYELILPWSLLTLTPTDVIGFSIRGRTRRLRLDQWRFSPDGTIKTELWADRQSAYTSNVTGLPAVPTTPPPPSIVGPTISAVLDIPGLTDELDTLNLIVAASGQTPAWYGAQHQRKLPSDPDYANGPTFNGVTTIMGLLETEVSDASPHFTDTTSVVRVSLYGDDDELQTYTDQQLLSENGAFALSWEDSGSTRWEVMQYRDAVKVGENVWELTTLLRGRLDTETAEHPAGSLFVLLDAGIRVMAMTSSMIGQDITHRAVSFGQNPDQAAPYTEEYTGQSQREWPIANLFASLNGSTLDASWVPRHRFGTDDNPIRSVNWDGYRVTATDGVNTETVETDVDGHSFDVTGWSTPITISVSQLNRITGEGPAVTEEVE